ncbi:MAG: translation elongation factor Ts [Myxococcales bacterium]|nr:translation elongation factor Ts [Myxococcales bacterium]
MEINAKMVMELRDKTGVGMMDCKKALQETAGDMEQAVDWLRKRGLSKAAKRADRAASNGYLGTKLSAGADKFTCVELNCESDFVAKTEGFIKLAQELAAHVDVTGTLDVEAVKNEKMTGNPAVTINDLLGEMLAKLGENIRIGRILQWQAAPGNKLGLYVHTGATAIGLSEMTGVAGKDVFVLGKNLGMQIVASKPQYLNIADVPANVLEHEKEIYREEAKAAGKPEKILDKIAEGKLAKFYQDNCLIKQLYVRDTEGKQTVEDLLKAEGVGLVRFARLMVGQV